MIDQKTVAEQTRQEMKIMNMFIEYRAFRRHIYGDVNKKLLDLMRNYINQYYDKCDIDAIDERFFDRFYLLYLPNHLLKLRPIDIKKLSREWTAYSEYANNRFKGSYKNYAIQAYRSHELELLRILYLIKEIRKYGEIPILSWDPLIIDMKCYKNLKNKEDALSKYMMFDQGYFKIQDKIGNWVIFFKETSIKTYYKIKMDAILTEEMKVGDILHMSIKRKIFCTSWSIINVKAYFGESSGIFLNQGGKKNEANKNC